MKVALKQGKIPTTNTTLSWTDDGFSSDVKLLLPFFSRATANDTQTAHGHISIGAATGTATDGTAQFTLSWDEADGITTATDTQTYQNAAWVASLSDYSSNGSIAEAAFTSFDTTGATITWSDINSEELVNALMLGGSDVEVTVRRAQLNSTTGVTVDHGLSGGAPNVILCFSICSVNNTSQYASAGFYDEATGTYRCLASYTAGGVGTTRHANIMLSNAIAAEYQDTVGTGKQWAATLSSIGSTSFVVTADGTTTDYLYFICIRVTGGAFKVGSFTTKTSTGTQADITGMSGSPSLVIFLSSSCSALDTLQDGAPGANSWGFGVAVNNGGTIEQGCVAKTGDDGYTISGGVNVTTEKCWTSNAKAGIIGNDSGALIIDWEVDSFDSGGITNKYTNFDATARYVAYLAIGVPTGSASTVTPNPASASAC